VLGIANLLGRDHVRIVPWGSTGLVIALMELEDEVRMDFARSAALHDIETAVVHVDVPHVIDHLAAMDPAGARHDRHPHDE
jgi:hypothetical protein